MQQWPLLETVTVLGVCPDFSLLLCLVLQKSYAVDTMSVPILSMMRLNVREINFSKHSQGKYAIPLSLNP